jgi:hypothetical protein
MEAYATTIPANGVGFSYFPVLLDTLGATGARSAARRHSARRYEYSTASSFLSRRMEKSAK